LPSRKEQERWVMASSRVFILRKRICGGKLIQRVSLLDDKFTDYYEIKGEFKKPIFSKKGPKTSIGMGCFP